METFNKKKCIFPHRTVRKPRGIRAERQAGANCSMKYMEAGDEQVNSEIVGIEQVSGERISVEQVSGERVDKQVSDEQVNEDEEGLQLCAEDRAVIEKGRG